MSTDDCHKRPVILDGATSSALHELGYEYNSSIEEWIFANIEKFSNLQKQYIEAGSEVVLTPTFSANALKLKEFGLDGKCEDINRRLAQITADSVRQSGKSIKIGASIGPTNLAVQPYSETSFTELLSLYSRQAQAISDCVDFFMIETMTSIADMRAAVLSCKRTDKPVFITVSVDEDGRTVGGEIPALGALVTLQEIGADAFGIGCSSLNDTVITLKKLAPYAKIPLIAKPYNSGEFTDDDINSLLTCGADYIGACCGSSPSDIRRIAEAADLLDFSEIVLPEPEDVSFIFTFEKQLFFLEPDTTEISEPIECLPDMEEIIVETCEQAIDILRVEINSADEAIDFARNAHMSTLPVMFLSHDELALKMALLYYQGRALIDSTTSIPEENLVKICEKYGSVIY